MVHWTGGRTKEIRGWRKIDRDSVREKGMMIRDNLGNWGRKRERNNDDSQVDEAKQIMIFQENGELLDIILLTTSLVIYQKGKPLDILSKIYAIIRLLFL